MGDLTKSGEVLAVAVNFIHTIADGQQLSFGTAFAADMPRAEKAALLDELLDLSARSAARAKRPSILAELRLHRQTLAQFVEDSERAVVNWPAARQALVDAIDEAGSEKSQAVRLEELQGQITHALDVLQKRRNDEYNAGLAEFQRLGRVADYKPKGFRATNLDRIDAEIKLARETAQKALEELEYERLKGVEAAKDALTKAEAEREVVIGNYRVSLDRYGKAIAGLEEQLAEADALLEA